jgi:hypothetical protein
MTELRYVAGELVEAKNSIADMNQTIKGDWLKYKAMMEAIASDGDKKKISAMDAKVKKVLDQAWELAKKIQSK